MLLSTSPSKWTHVEEVFMAAASGVASHLCFFIHGEHHMKAPLLFRLYTLLFSVLLYAKVNVKSQDPLLGAKETFEIFAVYTLSLLTSIVIYRKCFHRLRHFPGPFMASATKLWQTTKTLGSQNHLLLDDLHKKFGDFIRTGKQRKPTSRNPYLLTRRKISKVRLRLRSLPQRSNGRSMALVISATKPSGMIFFCQ